MKTKLTLAVLVLSAAGSVARAAAFSASVNVITRSVKISDEERGGWSSDRPRPDGRPARPPLG